VPIVAAGPDYRPQARRVRAGDPPDRDYAADMKPAFAFFRTLTPKASRARRISRWHVASGPIRRISVRPYLAGVDPCAPFAPLLSLLCAGLAQPLSAALPVGAKAPDFRTMGAVGGKPFKLHLKDQLRHGPLVLYFFPKAFTQGCTLEAKAFADAMPEFRKAGARVVGMSADDLPTLKRFSTEACRSAFPGGDRHAGDDQGL
jgi:hypothetical protein